MIRLAGRGLWWALIGNRWGRLALLGGVLALLAYWYRAFLIEDAYPRVWDEVVRAVGFGAVPISVWITLVLIVVRLHPRWLLRWWRWWLANGMLVVAAQAALGAVHGADGIAAEVTLGGRAGQALWGTSLLQGIPVVGGLLLLTQAILWPRSTYRETRGLLHVLKKLLAFLWLSWRWIRVAGTPSSGRKGDRFAPASGADARSCT